QRRPVEDRVELELCGGGELARKGAATLEVLDREAQRQVRVGQPRVLERLPRRAESAAERGGALRDVCGGPKLRRIEQSIGHGCEQVAQRGGVSALVADGEVRPRRVVAGRVPQSELQGVR